MSTTPAKGRCRACGREFRINADGAVRHHSGEPGTGLAWSTRRAYHCDGAGQPPAGADTLPDAAGHDRTPADNSPDTATDTPDVRPGQVWQDNDPRGYGRKLRIEAIDGTHAACVEVHITPQGALVLSTPIRRTRIRLDRFRPTSTGYRLIQDATDT